MALSPASMLTAHLKAAPPESGSGITFPPSSAQKRVLAEWPDDYRAGGSQRAGGERAGLVRHREH